MKKSLALLAGFALSVVPAFANPGTGLGPAGSEGYIENAHITVGLNGECNFDATNAKGAVFQNVSVQALRDRNGKVVECKISRRNHDSGKKKDHS